MNNAQLMRELKESEEIKQVINHLTQDIIDLYHIQIPIQDIDEAVKMFGGRVEESRYNDRYELIPKFDKTYQIKVPFVSREKENMLLARALCEIQTGIHNDMECKIIARRLLMPKQEFLDQIKKMKMFLDELILPILPDIFV